MATPFANRRFITDEKIIREVLEACKIIHIGIQDGDGVYAVSYTHLDVYKRQWLSIIYHADNNLAGSGSNRYHFIEIRNQPVFTSHRSVHGGLLRNKECICLYLSSITHFRPVFRFGWRHTIWFQNLRVQSTAVIV